MKSILLFLICGFSAFAQTKLIAYKSHSGSKGHFREALAANFGSVANSNLGENSQSITHTDSVIYVSESKVLLISRTIETVNGSEFRSTSSREILVPNLGEGADSARAALQRRFNWIALDSAKFIGFDKKPTKKKLFVPVSITDDNWPKFFFIVTLSVISLIAAIFVWKMQKMAAIRA